MAEATGNQSVSGLTEDEIDRIRSLRALIQLEMNGQSVSNRDAVMYAVNNELDRKQ